jgi:hypothetical protein
MSITLSIDGSVLDYKQEKVIAGVDGSTVGECIQYLVQQQNLLKKAILAENGDLSPGNYIRINGKYAYSDVLANPVRDGDQIEIVKVTGC